MAKINWNTVVNEAVKRAQSRGEEANVTQARNVVNDLVMILYTNYESYEILEGIARLVDRHYAKEPQK